MNYTGITAVLALDKQGLPSVRVGEGELSVDISTIGKAVTWRAMLRIGGELLWAADPAVATAPSGEELGYQAMLAMAVLLRRIDMEAADVFYHDRTAVAWAEVNWRQIHELSDQLVAAFTEGRDQ